MIQNAQPFKPSAVDNHVQSGTTIHPNKDGFSACLAEMLGTFTLVFIVFASGGSVAVAAALFVAAVAFGPISGGHFNPAVSAVKYANGDIDLKTFMKFFICQLIGAFAAWAVFMSLYKQIKIAVSNDMSGTGSKKTKTYVREMKDDDDDDMDMEN